MARDNQQPSPERNFGERFNDQNTRARTVYEVHRDQVIPKRGASSWMMIWSTLHGDMQHFANIILGEFLMKALKANNGLEFIVLREFVRDCSKLSRTHTMWTIQFLATGTTKDVHKSNASKGKVADQYSVTFCGVGYLGDFERGMYWRSGKQLWSNMIKRCYDEKYKAGYYGRGYTVDSRWKCFANFLSDLPKLDNFDKWLLGFKDGHTRYNLDKDLKIAGNKVYSREACSFITESENKAAGARNGKPFTKKQKKSKVGTS